VDVSRGHREPGSPVQLGCNVTDSAGDPSIVAGIGAKWEVREGGVIKSSVQTVAMKGFQMGYQIPEASCPRTQVLATLYDGRQTSAMCTFTPAVTPDVTMGIPAKVTTASTLTLHVGDGAFSSYTNPDCVQGEQEWPSKGSIIAIPFTLNCPVSAGLAIKLNGLCGLTRGKSFLSMHQAGNSEPLWSATLPNSLSSFIPDYDYILNAASGSYELYLGSRNDPTNNDDRDDFWIQSIDWRTNCTINVGDARRVL
jgi:hypothetical protein